MLIEISLADGTYAFDQRREGADHHPGEDRGAKRAQDERHD